MIRGPTCLVSLDLVLASKAAWGNSSLHVTRKRDRLLTMVDYLSNDWIEKSWSWNQSQGDIGDGASRGPLGLVGGLVWHATSMAMSRRSSSKESLVKLKKKKIRKCPSAEGEGPDMSEWKEPSYGNRHDPYHVMCCCSSLPYITYQTHPFLSVH